MSRKVISESKSDMSDIRAQFPVEACLFAVSEASNMLRLSRSRLYELISAGELKTVLIGRRRLVPGAELQRYIRELTTRAA